MYSIPVDFALKDLIRFCQPYGRYMKHLQILQAASNRHYMALCTFNSFHHAKHVYKRMNHKPFSSLCPNEICRLFFVNRVEVMEGKPIVDADNLSELPDCTICINRLDEPVDGLNLSTTILCNHTYHAKCLIPYEKLTCPVCRLIMAPTTDADLDNGVV